MEFYVPKPRFFGVRVPLGPGLPNSSLNFIISMLEEKCITLFKKSGRTKFIFILKFILNFVKKIFPLSALDILGFIEILPPSIPKSWGKSPPQYKFLMCVPWGHLADEK